MSRVAMVNVALFFRQRPPAGVEVEASVTPPPADAEVGIEPPKIQLELLPSSIGAPASGYYPTFPSQPPTAGRRRTDLRATDFAATRSALAVNVERRGRRGAPEEKQLLINQGAGARDGLRVSVLTNQPPAWESYGTRGAGARWYRTLSTCILAMVFLAVVGTIVVLAVAASVPVSQDDVANPGADGSSAAGANGLLSLRGAPPGPPSRGPGGFNDFDFVGMPASAECCFRSQSSRRHRHPSPSRSWLSSLSLAVAWKTTSRRNCANKLRARCRPQPKTPSPTRTSRWCCCLGASKCW